MTDPASLAPTGAPADTSPEQQALQAALAGLMASVAKLAVARGLPYAPVEELLRQAFVQAAAEAHPGLPEHRKVSRISTTTGLNRREVSRLVEQRSAAAAAPAPRSLASEVFAHWRTQAPFVDAQGQPHTLPRLPAADGGPSFDTLAQAVTRNVHPRSLLDELCRLGLAQWDAEADTVALVREIFVARGDVARQLGFLGDNVGDHLRAAVANVTGGDDRAHFEQAVWADGLSAASIEAIRPAVRDQWQALLKALVPLLEARVAADAALTPAPNGRLRVGLYTFQEGTEVPAAPAAPPKPRRAIRKT